MNMSVNGMGGGSAPMTMSGASMRSPPPQRMAKLYDKIDTSGSGSITKAQFEQAFASLKSPPAIQVAGIDALWEKLDPKGSGAVSKEEFIKNMTAEMGHLQRAPQGPPPGNAQNAPPPPPPPSQTIAASMRQFNMFTQTGWNVNITA